MFKRWRRNRRLNRVAEGDGSQLKPFRWYQLLTRSAFTIELVEPTPEPQSHQQERPVRYAVDVRYFADDAYSDFDWTLGLGDWLRKGESSRGSRTTRRNAPPAGLYRDGIQIRRSNLPATFKVPGGYIEAATTMYGVSRMHFVREDGAEQILEPFANSPEGLRARIGARFPRLNRVVGALAVAVLLLGLAVAVPQILEKLTSIPEVSARVGTFVSPINVPAWANTVIATLSVIAALERALTHRNHWLVDFDTFWLGGV